LEFPAPGRYLNTRVHPLPGSRIESYLSWP